MAKPVIGPTMQYRGVQRIWKRKKFEMAENLAVTEIRDGKS
jgi:hypothetical protein